MSQRLLRTRLLNGSLKRGLIVAVLLGLVAPLPGFVGEAAAHKSDKNGKSKQKRGVPFLGISGDPMHLGHMEILERGAATFGSAVLVLAKNDKKTPMFTFEERLAMAQSIYNDNSSITVTSAEGTLVRFAQKWGEENHVRPFLLRGLRNATDLAYEQPMDHANRAIAPKVLTTYILTNLPISSTGVRELASLHEWKALEQYVHPLVTKALKSKIAEREKN